MHDICISYENKMYVCSVLFVTDKFAMKAVILSKLSQDASTRYKKTLRFLGK